MFKGDYLGFTFDSIHSSELGITRCTSGNRVSNTLLPDLNNKIATIPGRDESYYYGANFNTKTFDIEFGYEKLTDSQVRNIKKLFGDKNLHWLTFDEEPFKSYLVVVSKVPSLTMVAYGTYEDRPIEKVGQTPMGKPIGRTFAGEGSMSFTCLEPYAHSRVVDGTILKYKEQYLNEDEETLVPEWQNDDGELVPTLCNYEEWIDSVALVNQEIEEDVILDTFEAVSNSYVAAVYNPGDGDADFTSQVYSTSNSMVSAITFSLLESSPLIHLTLSDIQKQHINDVGIQYNGKLHLLEGIDSNGNKTGTLYNQFITSGDFFKIPADCEIYHIQVSGDVNAPSLEYGYLFL